MCIITTSFEVMKGTIMKQRLWKIWAILAIAMALAFENRVVAVLGSGDGYDVIEQHRNDAKNEEQGK